MTILLWVSLLFMVTMNSFGLYMLYLIAITLRDEMTQIDKIIKLNRTITKRPRK